MEFTVKKKRKYKRAEKFVIKMKKVQEKAKAVLEKVQKEIKKYTNKKRGEIDEYKVGDLVMLSTKNLRYQMIGRRTEKLTKRFVGPYKVKRIVLANTVDITNCHLLICELMI